MMNSTPILPSDLAERARRISLGAAALAGIVAAVIVLSSQEVTDFLREGPARVTDLHGDDLQAVLGIGTIAAAVIVLGALWTQTFALRVVIAAVALAGGLFLVHALFMPAATLIAVALGADLAQRVPRERVERFSPRRMPLAWAGIGVVGVAALVGIVWLSVWLLQPLFDEGTELNEGLAFTVQGVDTSGSVAAAPAAEARSSDDGEAAASESAEETESGEGEAAASDAESAEQTAAEASEDAAEASGDGAAEPEAVMGAEGEGALISSGVLMGTDDFHTGSGDILLLRDPEGMIILRFQDYDVRNGPDLHVYLTPDPDGDVHADGAIDLGEVRATSGNVNYVVPEGVDPTIFRSVVIYCVPFSVTFATASLTPS